MKKRVKDSAYYKNISTTWLVFCYLGIAEAVIGFFAGKGLQSFISGILGAIISAIIAMAKAKKVDSPDKEKLKKWGKIGIIVSVVASVILIVMMLLAVNTVKKSGLENTLKEPDVTEKAKKSDKNTDKDVVATIDPTIEATAEADDTSSEYIEYSDEELAGLTYEDIYNEYIPKINQAAEDAVNEYKAKSVGMSDDEKFDLADQMVEKINAVSSEGIDKMHQLSDKNEDYSDERFDWMDKLSDHATEKAGDIYDLEYAE